MSFLAIIIALVCLQIWGSGSPMQHDLWFRRWQARVAGWGLTDGIRLILQVLAPVALAAFVLNAVEPVLFGLLWIALACALLLYSFGRGDFHALMARYRSQCHSGDFEGAFLMARTELDWDAGTTAAESPQQVHELIQRGLLYEGYQRWFAVLFYFVLLGPAAALAYRLLQLSRRDLEPTLGRRCLALADWLPARLLACTFALAGDFVGSREALVNGFLEPAEEAAVLLHEVGLAALGPVPAVPGGDVPFFGETASAQNREFAALLSRSAVSWVALIALAVLLL